jgi:hypothetical protein
MRVKLFGQRLEKIFPVGPGDHGIVDFKQHLVSGLDIPAHAAPCPFGANRFFVISLRPTIKIIRHHADQWAPCADQWALFICRQIMIVLF